MTLTKELHIRLIFISLTLRIWDKVSFLNIMIVACWTVKYFVCPGYEPRHVAFLCSCKSDVMWKTGAELRVTAMEFFLPFSFSDNF